MQILSRYGGVAKLVIAPACQAGDHGFNPRRSRIAAIREIEWLLLF